MVGCLTRIMAGEEKGRGSTRYEKEQFVIIAFELRAMLDQNAAVVEQDTITIGTYSTNNQVNDSTRIT